MNTLIKTKRILVVDDERPVCASVEKILTRQGHVVEKSLSVSEAVAQLEHNHAFDLIIADLMMPQAGGLDLLRIVTERRMGIPLLIMTGYASIGSAIEATKLGAAGYVPKPFTPDELQLAIEKAVTITGPGIAAGPSVKTTSTTRPAPKATDPIDVDMPFDRAEVTAATSPEYVQHLTRSDMPMIDFCDLGQRACKRYKSKGVCNQPECPLVAAERRKMAAKTAGPQVADMIDVDMPFSMSEVSAATSEAYAHALGRSDMAVTGRWDPSRATGRKVLVVDDEPVVVNSIRRALTRRGYAVSEAFSANEALNRILNEMYDLVLLDMRMPDANGLEMLPTIRKHRPALPVVMVTGYASIDTAVEAIRRGAKDYMAKPFTPEELYAVASKAMRAGSV